MRILLAAALAVLPQASQACAVLAPFELARIGQADLVLVGEVTGYEALGPHAEAALVTLRVEEALKGEAEGDLVLVWNSGMAQGPHQARATGRVLLGAMAAGNGSAAAFADARPDLPELAQEMCGEVWMVPASDAALTTARAALD